MAIYNVRLCGRGEVYFILVAVSVRLCYYRAMLFSRLLGRFAGTVSMIREGPVGGKVDGPALCLSKQLDRHVQVIKGLPHTDGEGYLVSQELADGLEGVLALVLDRLPEFVEDHDACQLTLESLTRSLTLLQPERSMPNDYLQRYQDLHYLWDLVRVYKQSLERLQEIVGLWPEGDPDSIDALTRLLKTGVEALRVGRKMELYAEQILPSNPGTLGGGKQERPAGPAGDACRQASEDMKLAAFVCDDYGELGREMSDLLGRMAKDVECVLGALEGLDYVFACQFFREYLEDIFKGLLCYSPATMRHKAPSFEYDRWQRPSEVLAQIRLEILWKILGLKLKFPELARDGIIENVLSPDSLTLRIAVDDGPPLIETEVILWELDRAHVNLRPRGSLADLSNGFEESIDRLGKWVHSLYQRLRSRGDRSVSAEMAKEWTSQVEDNLGLVLEAVETNGGRQRLYVLGGLIKRLVAVAFNIERVLGKLYAPEQLERGHNGPGHFLAKLGQMVEKSLCVVAKESDAEGVGSLLAALEIERGDAEVLPSSRGWSFEYEPDADKRTIRAFQRFCQSEGPRTVARIGRLVTGTEEGEEGPVESGQRLIRVGTCKSPEECSLAGFVVNRREGKLLLAPASNEAMMWLRFGDRELGDAMEYQWFRRALDEEMQGREWRVRMSGLDRILAIDSWLVDGGDVEGSRGVIVEEDGEPPCEGDYRFFVGAWNWVIRRFGRSRTDEGWHELSLSARRVRATRGYLGALKKAGSLWALAVSQSVPIPLSLSESLYGALCGETVLVDDGGINQNLYHAAFVEGAHRVINGQIFKRIGKQSLQKLWNPVLWGTRIIQSARFYPNSDHATAWRLCRRAQQLLTHLDPRQRALAIRQLWGRPAPTMADYFEAWDSRVQVDHGKEVSVSPNRLVMPTFIIDSALSRYCKAAVRPSMLIRLAAGLVGAGREEHLVPARRGRVFEALHQLYREKGAAQFVKLKLVVQVIDGAGQGVAKLECAADYGLCALGEAGMAGLLCRGTDGLGYTLCEASENGQQDKLRFLGFLFAYLAIVHRVIMPVNIGHELALLTFYGTKGVRRPLYWGEGVFLEGFAQVVPATAAQSVDFEEWSQILAFDSTRLFTLMGCKTNYACFLRLAQLASTQASKRGDLQSSTWEEYVAMIGRDYGGSFAMGRPSSAERWLLLDTVAALLAPAAKLVARDDSGVYHLAESAVACKVGHREGLRILGRVLGKMMQWGIPIDYELGDEIGDRVWNFGRGLVGEVAADGVTEDRIGELVAGIFDVVPPGAFSVLRRGDVKELTGCPASMIIVMPTMRQAKAASGTFKKALNSFPSRFKYLLWRWASGALEVKYLPAPELRIKLEVGEKLSVHVGKGIIVIPRLESPQKYSTALVMALMGQGFGGSWNRLFSLAQISMAERVAIWHRKRMKRDTVKLAFLVSRQNILDGAWRLFQMDRPGFTERLWKVEFSSDGRLQPGVDAGGPLREWICLASVKLLGAGNGLFELSERGGHYQIVRKRPSLGIRRDVESTYYFAGIIIGEAFYSGVALGASLSPLLCEVLASGNLERFDYLGALERIDHDSYVMLRGIDVDNGEEYYFEDGAGCELVSNGSNVRVTGKDLFEKYCELMARRILLGAEPWYFEMFVRGFWSRIGNMTLRSYGFIGADVQARLRGRVNICVKQWRRQTVRKQEGSVSEGVALEVAGWFWKIFEKLGQEQLRKLLKFCTGMLFMPLRGFNDTSQGHFVLRIMPRDDNRLPIARTCFNELQIPAYGSEAILQTKLEQAIAAADEGFEMA